MLSTVCFANYRIESGTKLRTLVEVPHTLNAIPVTFINGKYDGPTVLVTSGVHGSEYPGIAASMELGKELNPEDIHGCLVIMHPVNVSAFWAHMAEICPEDGLNLNRVFPGNSTFSRTYKLADFLLNEFILKADYYLDLHSGDLQEDLHPYAYFPGNASIWFARLPPRARITARRCTVCPASLWSGAVPVSAAVKISTSTRTMSCMSCNM